MKPYHILNNEGLKEIQQETFQYIKLHIPNILNDHGLWNKIDSKHFLSRVTHLHTFLSQYKQKAREVSFTVLTNREEKVNLHIDELPVVAKINIPIINTNHTYNQWYEIPDYLKQDPKYKQVNKFGKEYYSFKDLDIAKCKLVGEIECKYPIVFNSQLAHNVVLGTKANLPRVVMCVMLFKEPISFLLE